MKVLCIGGAGFVGAWIMRRLLASGHEVVLMDRSPDRRVVDLILGADASRIDWHVGDVTDPTDIFAAGKGCDAVVHLAAMLTPACRADPVRGANVNLIGTINVFEFVRQKGIKKFAYASTAGVFGPDNGLIPAPTTLYGAFKLACEGVGRSYAADYGVSSVGFRPLTVYGPGRELGASAGPSIACRHAARGDAYVIPFSGRTDFIYVEDVAAAFELALLKSPCGSHIFNLRGEADDVANVAKLIQDLAPGSTITVEGEPMPITAELEPDGVFGTIGWRPTVSLSDGLRRTIEFYRTDSRG